MTISIISLFMCNDKNKFNFNPNIDGHLVHNALISDARNGPQNFVLCIWKHFAYILLLEKAIEIAFNIQIEKAVMK